MLATGAEPTRLPVPGADDPAVRVLRTLDHLRELQRRLGRGESAIVVIGSGFIGCEIAASLRMRGHRGRAGVRRARAERRAARRRSGRRYWRGWLQEQGVALHLGTRGGADRAVAGESSEVIADGSSVSGDVVIMATGVAPRGELAAATTGIELADGAIPVDADDAVGDGRRARRRRRLPSRRTSRPAGRCASSTGATRSRQGEIAGATAAGKQVAWDEVPGFWSTIGDAHAEVRGLGRRLRSGPAASATPTEASRSGTGATGGSSACSTHEADGDYERGPS